MKKVAVFLLLMLVCVPPLLVRAAEPELVIVVLKSGGQLEGVIRDQSEDALVLDVGFGTVGLSKKEIDRIELPEGEGREKVLSAWRRERALIRKAGTDEEKKRELGKHLRREEENLRLAREKAESVRQEEEHRIKFGDSARIVVDTVINGEVSTPLLVDTGATMVLLPIEVAEELGIIDEHPAQMITTRFVDGTEREGIPMVLESVEVGGVRAENVPAAAMDLKGHSGLLGMSFLSRFHMRIDSRNKELILKEK